MEVYSLVISGGLLAVQITIAAVSYYKIYRHRIIYGIETAVLRGASSGKTERTAPFDVSAINEKLESGRYTVLKVMNRPGDDYEIIFGRIK